MTTLRTTVAVGIALAVVLLLTASVIGQTSAFQMAPYGQLAGCSEKPLEFHRCAMEKAKAFNPPRMPDGTPDFRGYWARARVSTDNIEEHPQSFENPGGVSMVVDPPDQKVPYQPWALAARQKHPTTYYDTQSACFAPGPPRQAYA